MTAYLFSIDNFIWRLYKIFVLEFIPFSCIYGRRQPTVSVYTLFNVSMIENMEVPSTNIRLANSVISKTRIKKDLEDNRVHFISSIIPLLPKEG
jgi:hypothetical protein